MTSLFPPMHRFKNAPVHFDFNPALDYQYIGAILVPESICGSATQFEYDIYLSKSGYKILSYDPEEGADEIHRQEMIHQGYEAWFFNGVQTLIDHFEQSQNDPSISPEFKRKNQAS